MHKLNHAQLAALVKRVQRGDSQAFATLYAATVESQLYFATSFLKDAALAEDAVQEVYLSVYRTLHRLVNPKLFVAYLNRICYNTCVDFKNKQTRYRGELNEEVLADRPDENTYGSPDDRYAMMEEANELQKALARLPDQQRATFLMRYYNDMKIHEIAEAMDCSESTVKRNIRVATGSLKEMLQSGSSTPAVKKEKDYAP